MTITQLIDRLQQIRVAQDDDFNILTRGSQTTTMVPAEDVRVVRLKSGGTGVFIGKAKTDRL